MVNPLNMMTFNPAQFAHRSARKKFERTAATVSQRTHLRWLMTGIFVLQWVLASLTQALVVDASVDSTEVRMGETLQLTIKIDDSSNGNEPDLSALEKDFRVLTRQTGSSTRLLNRSISTETSWVITLLPKHKGTITIAPIDFDGVLSKAITVNVSDAAKPGSVAQAGNQLVFLEAEVDASEVYVQQQVIFTLRLYKRTELMDPSLTMPDVEDAVQEKLGAPRSFNTVVDGRDYEVIENRFAYFPQKSGNFTIPPAELNATIAVGGNGFLDPFLGMTGKQIRRASNGIEIKVKPKPANYPADAAWLPTTHVSIEESINPNKTTFKVGEPITRVVTVEATGVAPSLLPPLPVPEGQGFKVYPEPADAKGLPDAKGISSRRAETHSYIPTKAGTLNLPPVEIAYWNVREDRLDKAVLPGHTITVTPASPSAATPPPLATQPPAASTGASQTQPPTSIGVTTVNNPLWQWISGALLIGWLTTLGIWFWQSKKRPVSAASPALAELNSERISDKRDALMQACKQNHPVAARKALVAWFKALEKNHSVHSLGHVRQYAMSAPLANAATELEHMLYNPTEGIQWSSDALRKGIADEESQRRIKARETQSNLDALYPGKR